MEYTDFVFCFMFALQRAVLQNIPIGRFMSYQPEKNISEPSLIVSNHLPGVCMHAYLQMLHMYSVVYMSYRSTEIFLKINVSYVHRHSSGGI